jgi:penicillin amidase
MRKNRWMVIFFILIFTGFAVSADAAVKTVRDNKGVWFIKGAPTDSLYDVFEAMGYAVATDRLWQAESFRRAAKGELAAVFGPDFLGQDMLVRMTGYTQAELTAGYNSLDTDSKMMIDGYVAGFNRRIVEITANAAIRPFEFHALKFVPAPWIPEDVMAWQALMLRQFDPEAQKRAQLDNAALLQYLTTVFGPAAGMGMFYDLRWINDPSATTYIPASGAPVVSGMSFSGFAAANSTTSQEHIPALSLDSMPGTDLQAVAENLEHLWSDREEKLKKINAYAGMGSYAWVISGDKTASGLPIIYSGPQMGFDTPAIIMEGSIDAAGLKISGMSIAGLPGIVIGRTPHHAWSMQVGHARTTDYYFEPPPAMAPAGYYTSRMETIQVAGQGPVTIRVYRSPHGPLVSPMNFNPETYDMTTDGPIVAWKYAHWGKELATISAFLKMARAQSMDEFGAALEDVGVSQHFCYADNKGNIAYWMSGVDYIRPNQNAQGFPVDWRIPQGMLVNPAEWTTVRRPLSSDRNNPRGFYTGWNNKTSPDYGNAFNNMSYYFGPFHRAHVLEEYLTGKSNLTFEQIRDLALNIATTDSFGSGGNPWKFVKTVFRRAVTRNPSAARSQALGIMDDFDGHFVDGGPADWASGMDRSDAWMLADAWIREVINLTFMDELGNSIEYDQDKAQWKNPTALFNVLIRALAGENASIVNNYNWFRNVTDPEAPRTATAIIVAALDNVLAALGERPWGINKRGEIEFNHPMFNNPPVAHNPLHKIPFSSRSTYAHCVEMGKFGPTRIESMFPLGQSGDIRGYAIGTELIFDPNFYSMTGVYDDFSHRSFKDETGKSGSTCFIRTLMDSL